MSSCYLQSMRRVLIIGCCLAAAVAVAACTAGKPRPTPSPTPPVQRYSVDVVLNKQPAGALGPRDLRELPQLTVAGAKGPTLLSSLGTVRIKDFKSLVVTGMAQNGKDLNAVGIPRSEVDDRVLLVLNAAGTMDLVRDGAPKDQWVYSVKRIDVDGNVEQVGPPYKLSILLRGKELATLTIEDLALLEQVTSGNNKGPTLSSVLARAGVGDYSRLTIKGESLGRVGAAEMTLTRGQVGDRVILDFTKRGTAKVSSPDIPNTQWVLDVTTIDVDGVAATGSPGPGTGGGGGTGTGGGTGGGKGK